MKSSRRKVRIENNVTEEKTQRYGFPESDNRIPCSVASIFLSRFFPMERRSESVRGTLDSAVSSLETAGHKESQVTDEGRFKWET